MKNLYLMPFIVFVLIACSPNNINEKKTVLKNIEIDSVSVGDAVVNVVIVKDEAFYRLLDTLITYESRCSYYTDTLSFGIWIDKSLTNTCDSVVTVSIMGKSEKEFFIKGSYKQLLIGYFPYKKHNFYVFGRNILESLIITKKKGKMKNCKEYHPYEDDRWAIYRFLYYNKKFILYEIENDWLCK